MATCPECDAELDIDEFDVDKGDVISCHECGSSLEITSLAPLEVELIGDDDEEEEEDEDEDGEDEDELDEDDDDDEEDWEE